MSLSRITGNSAPLLGDGLFVAAGTAIAENNWWGCDDFPRTSGPAGPPEPCDTVSGADVDPRLDLVVTATPSTINGGGTSSVTADLSKNSAGAAVLPVVLNGLPITFGADFGTMSPNPVSLAAFMATSTYTNTSCPSTPPEMVMATLDNGTDAADVTITCLTTTTTTTLPPTTTTTTLPPTTTTTTLSPPPPTTTLPPPQFTCNGLPATIVGTNGSEIITGTAGDDVIDGRGGNDLIRGLGGRDVICGGSGNDALFGQTGNDAMNGGPGFDACSGGPGTDTAVSCEIAVGVP